MPIVVGEFGGFFESEMDIAWQRWGLRYAASRHFGLFYFGLNPNSGDTGGLLLDDWTTLHAGTRPALHPADASQPCMPVHLATMCPLTSRAVVGTLPPPARACARKEGTRRPHSEHIVSTCFIRPVCWRCGEGR